MEFLLVARNGKAPNLAAFVALANPYCDERQFFDVIRDFGLKVESPEFQHPARVSLHQKKGEAQKSLNSSDSDLATPSPFLGGIW
jgi:hypothetical protein